MTYANEFGSKYEQTKDLNHKDLKKLMQADLKVIAKKHGCKLTLRERHYGSMYVTVREPSFKIVNPAAVEHTVTQPHEPMPRGLNRYTDAFLGLEREIEAALGAYNYDRSDIQTDYFNVRFYLHVEPAQEVVEAETRAIIDAASPLRARRFEIAHTTWAVTNDWRAENGLKPMDAWLATEPARIQKAITQALGAEHTQALIAECSRIDAQIAANDDWKTVAA
jgi:hypothetical protein